MKKRSLLTPTAAFLSALALVGIGAADLYAGKDCGKAGVAEPVDAFDDGSCGSSCVMVFGEVGEPLRVAFGETEACEIVEGRNASGKACSLPLGLRFSKDDLALSGVPQNAGFFEFVLLETESGVTREKVVLIDIQGRSLSSIGAGYASTNLDGIR